MTEKRKSLIGIASEKGTFTVGMTLIIWSIIIAVTAGASDGGLWLILFFTPPLGAYLVISSTINILRAIRDGY